MMLDSCRQATYNHFYRDVRIMFNNNVCVTWRDAYLQPLPIDVRLAIMRGLKNVI
ncbi:hypothetical protein SSYM_1340 [Serratia symbiotica str. Tucson]|uniref:Uncharacterized protein n=1 Tax=Serratia symbiotica str. Tucson TaxID=914128 RepID=E9CM30_9GAMM|nr:hypothetical protein SSYM_1340 [Serratia symbiotica str. Tucson]